MIGATDIDRLLNARRNGNPELAADERVTRSCIRPPELEVLSLVYASTNCDSTEAAIEGFRLGWECGRLRLPDIPLTNRPWSRWAIDPVWCDLYGVGKDAVKRVVDTCGALPGPGVAVRAAFELGHEASTLSPQ